MPPIALGAAFAVASLAARKQVANIALAMAMAAARKVLTAAIKQGGPRVQNKILGVAVQLEGAATRYEELAAAEPRGKKRLYLGAEAAGARGIAAGLREIAAMIEQNADDAAVESAVAKAEEKIQELASRRQQPAVTE